MLGFVILGLALLTGFLLVAQWFVNADPKSIIPVFRWAGAIFAFCVLLLLVYTNAWQWLPIIAIGLLPWLRQFRAISRMAKSARGPSPGQQSAVDTQFFEMSLDHDTGEMDGYVKLGRYGGRALSTMNREELLSLFSECLKQDEQSAAVLAAYLDRAYPEWRDQAGYSGAEGSGPAGGKMTIEEARSILGVDENATSDDIKDAHRRLMKQFHPDQGGSSYLAAKINEAKEMLLG